MMSAPIKINENISISKEQIQTNYQQMDIFFKNGISALYGDNVEENFEVNCFLPCNIIKESGKNSYKCFNTLKNKSGVYLFLNNNTEPVYIGIGGEKLNGQDLERRLIQEVNVYVKKDSNFKTKYAKNSGATLSKNIQDIDSILENNEVTPDNSIERIKLFSILTLSVGKINDKNSVLKSRSFETILIALFKPKYNK